MKRTDAVAFLKALSMVGVYGGLLMPLVFIPVVIFPFVFSKLIALQVLIGLTFPAYLVLAWMEPQYRPRHHLLYSAIAAYFGAIALSVLFAVDPMRAWWGNQERMNGLFTVLHFFAWLTMAVSLLKTWNQWKRLLGFEIVLSVVMAAVAMMQKINPNLLMFPAGPRVGGLLDNPIYMAAYQLFNLFFILLLWLRSTSWNVRGVLLIAAGLDIIAFILTQSRGGLVGLGVGILVFVLFYGAFTKQKKARIGIFAGFAALVLAYGGLFLAKDQPVIANSPLARLVNFSGGVTTRLIAWEIAWEGFKDRPLTGWGFDNFHILFNQKYNPQSLRFGSYETWFDRSHNTIMDVMSMTGVLGLMTFIGIYVTLFMSVIRAFRKQWIDLPFAAVLCALPVGYFVQNLFVFDHPAAFTMSFLMFGLIIAATRGKFEDNLKAEEPGVVVAGSRSFSWALFTVVFLAFVLLVWRASILPFQVSRLSIMANSNFSVNPDRALEYAKQAAEISTPYLDEQTFLISRNIIVIASSGQFDKLPHFAEWVNLVQGITEHELARHPENTHPWFIAGRMSHELALTRKPEYNNQIAVAEARYRRAIELSPKRQQLYENLARLQIQTGKVDNALATLKEARDFDPELGQGYWMYGLSLTYDKKDVAEGSKQILKAFESPYPYNMTDAKEILPYADAVFQVNNPDSYRVFVNTLMTAPRTSAAVYAQFAQRLEVAGQPTLRDQIFTIDPSIKAEYDKLKAGKK